MYLSLPPLTISEHLADMQGEKRLQYTSALLWDVQCCHSEYQQGWAEGGVFFSFSLPSFVLQESIFHPTPSAPRILMPHSTPWMHSNMDALQLAAAANSDLFNLPVTASETVGQINCADPWAGSTVSVEFHTALSWYLSCLLGKELREHFHK